MPLWTTPISHGQSTRSSAAVWRRRTRGRALTNSVERLATSVEDMVKEQEKQGKRLEVLEGRDGEMWRKVVGYIITAVIGIVIGFVFHQVGM